MFGRQVKVWISFHFILEDKWLEEYKTHIDHKSKACMLYKGNKKITIQSVIISKKTFFQDKIFSTLQFNRVVKEGCYLYLFILG